MSASVAGLAASRALHRAYWFYRAYRLEKALKDLRDAVERKYGYDRNQPRVPAGNPHGGEWTDGGSGTGSGRSNDERLIRVAQNDDPDTLTDVPPRPRNLPSSIQSLSDIPKEKPAETKPKNAIIKFLAHRMVEIVEVQAALRGIIRGDRREEVAHRVSLALLGAKIAPWIAEEGLPRMLSYYDPPKTLEELRDAVSRPRAGTQVHHIVERNSEQPGEKARIYSRENEVRIPEFKHHAITGWYTRENKVYGKNTLREGLKDQDWATRYQEGIDALIQFGVLKP